MQHDGPVNLSGCGRQSNLEVAQKQFPIGGREIELETSAQVFYPTSTSQMIAKVLHIPPGASVLDMGCGVGVLAIYAALAGAGHVVATDVMPEACRLAALNAERNNVAGQVQVVCGDLWQPLQGQQFDVIIDDVSGIADEVARLSSWFPDPVPTGGPDGTHHVVKMLESVREHLRPGGVLYLPMSSLSHVGRILAAAKGVFGERMEELSQVNFPFGPELKAHMARLEELRAEGIIDFTNYKSRHFWSLHIYRAWVP